jgi:4-amino-4-deoxy-L-arabinose transferase-like glycosyltransferase
MWGQHLSWSYFDHPPLDGWLQGLVALVLPWSNFSVRALTWLSFGGTLWIVWLWSGRLAPAARSDWFWHAAVIYLTIPVIALMSTLAVHDHLLLFFVAASLYAFHGFAGDWEDGRRSWGKLYLAAALLGLAVLTKYNGVFLGLGYAMWILARPKLRSLLRTPHLWLAALLAIAIQAPVFYWNLTEHFASFRFHLEDRPSANWQHPRLNQIPVFLGVMVVAMSPVLFLSLLRWPWLKPRGDAEARASSLSASVWLVGTIAFAAMSAYVLVYFHWNIVAYAALVPIALRLLGHPIAIWLHILIGVVIFSGAIANYALMPLGAVGIADPGTAANYGWPQLAARVTAQQQAHPDAFLAATRYNYASQLGYQLHDTGVAAFNHTPSQYDYWWDKPAHAGRDAIIIADHAADSRIGEAKARFASLEKLEDVPVIDAFGKPVWTFEIWLGKGYTGD